LLKLNNILQIENIDNILFKDSYDIERFKINSKVLLLSSNKNSSGIDLSFVKNLIIFEPIKGSSNFMKDIKKQIIGRIYRIGQLNEINIYFLITQNTIEETDYK
jgi:SNF2 family DNA or RNA helicase